MSGDLRWSDIRLPDSPIAQLRDILSRDDIHEQRHWLRENALLLHHALWGYHHAAPMKSRVDLAHECFDLEHDNEEAQDPTDVAAGPADVDADRPIRIQRPAIWPAGHGPVVGR
jgi:hypothetical protein